MARFWLDNVRNITTDTDLMDFGSNKIRTTNAIEFDSAGIQYIDGDGDNLRIAVKANADVIFMNGATDVAYANETGLVDLVP